MKRATLIVGLLLLLQASLASAAAIPFEGQLKFEGGIPSLATAVKNGVADVTLAPSGVGRLTLLEGAIGGPPVSAPIFFLPPLSGIRITASNAAGTLSKPSAMAHLRGAMPLQGFMRACLFGACTCLFGDCDQTPLVNVTLPLSVVGAGGATTATGPVNFTVRGAPWTSGTAVATRIPTIPTPDGAQYPPQTTADAGSRHTTANGGIDLNLVTPVFIQTSIPLGTFAGYDYDSTFAFVHMLLHLDTEPRCADGTDDDGDGLVDFPDDPGCSSAEDVSENDPSLPCDDGIDNDGDGSIDAGDPGCTGPADPSEREPGLVCDDGVDEDGDGLSDRPQDPGCTAPDDPSEREDALVCDNDLDEDGDGAVSYPADPGCRSARDAYEVTDFVNIYRTSGCEEDPCWPWDVTLHASIDDDVLVAGSPNPPYKPSEIGMVDGSVITGDLDLLYNLDVTIEGGSVEGTVRVDPTFPIAGTPKVSRIQISGGSISGDLISMGPVSMEIRGGSLGGTLVVEDSAAVRIVGTPSNHASGLVTETSGVLEGSFEGGAPFAIPFTRDPGGVLIVPEPSASATVAAFTVFLLGAARRRPGESIGEPRPSARSRAATEP